MINPLLSLIHSTVLHNTNKNLIIKKDNTVIIMTITIIIIIIKSKYKHVNIITTFFLQIASPVEIKHYLELISIIFFFFFFFYWWRKCYAQACRPAPVNLLVISTLHPSPYHPGTALTLPDEGLMKGMPASV